MSAVGSASSPQRPAAARSGSTSSTRRSARRPRVSGPVAWLGVCLGAAILSWAVLPSVVSYDPWSWLVWGREVSDPALPFVISGGPSWKPLPFLFTTVWGLAGGGAPTLWLITARTGGLLGIVAGGRLAQRLSGGGPGGALAAALGACGVMLTEQWMYYFLRATSEPLVIGATLWAIDRLLAGRRTQALWLGIALALMRPESWPLLAGYAVWLWVRDPGYARWPMRVTLLAGLALVPVLWLVPPWIGSGDALLAAQHAAAYDGRLGAQPARALLTRGANDQVAPLLIAGIGFVVIAWWRDRDRTALALGIFVIAWWAIVVAMTAIGYPGLERFYLPAAAVTSVLGAAGIARLAAIAGRAAGDHRRAAAAAAAAVLVAVSVWGSAQRISDARSNFGLASQASRMIGRMERAVTRAGGHRVLYRCGSRSFVAVNHSLQTALAWYLHVPLERVSGVMSAPGADVVGPSNPADGVPAAIDSRLTGARILARADGWRVVARSDPHNRPADSCVPR